jgi:hypothetical protein
MNPCAFIAKSDQMFSMSIYVRESTLFDVTFPELVFPPGVPGCGDHGGEEIENV